jgi:hypothetical protein
MGGRGVEEAVNDASIPLVRPAILKSNNNQHLMQQMRGRAIVDGRCRKNKVVDKEL